MRSVSSIKFVTINSSTDDKSTVWGNQILFISNIENQFHTYDGSLSTNGRLNYIQNVSSYVIENKIILQQKGH
jgi:hypothetical protein